MKNIVICGDSFNVGIGCSDLKTQPYGSLLAKRLDGNLINFAKGSSSNLSIYLQVKYAIDTIKDIDLMYIGITCNTRTEWFSEKSKDKRFELSNTMVNYHQYPPYGDSTNGGRNLPNPMVSDPNYTGELLTENYFGVVDYVNNIINSKKPNYQYFEKFRDETDDKMKLLYDYYLNFYDHRIQRVYDMGVMVMAHQLLTKYNINHYFLTNDNGFLEYIDTNHLINVDWVGLARLYPDEFGSQHTSPVGHNIVYRKILTKMGIEINESDLIIEKTTRLI